MSDPTVPKKPAQDETGRAVDDETQVVGTGDEAAQDEPSEGEVFDEEGAEEGEEDGEEG